METAAISRQAVWMVTVVGVWTDNSTGYTGNQSHGVGGQGHIVCYKLGTNIGNTLHRYLADTLHKVRSKY